MKNYRDITTHDIAAMNYNELIGLVRETNRTPGGNRSIFEVSTRCYLTRQSKVLDIGCSTGPTSIEIARLVGCEVVGIDINERSLQEGRTRAHKLALENVRFEQSDATRLPFENETFDLVFCGNVTSLIDDKNKAFSEYQRVTKFDGFIAAIPMYYVETPSDTLVDEVRRAIQVEIPVHYREQAVQFYTRRNLELYDTLDFRFDDVAEERVQEFCQEILSRPHLDELTPAVKAALTEKYTRYMLLFRENLSLMGFTIVLLRKTRFKEDAELFTAQRLLSRSS
jgi:ubiquinone/menaquinone biosynthesis C-methylase UbiE